MTHLRLEAHVEHPVGLIQHHVGGSAQVGDATYTQRRRGAREGRRLTTREPASDLKRLVQSTHRRPRSGGCDYVTFTSRPKHRYVITVSSGWGFNASRFECCSLWSCVPSQGNEGPVKVKIQYKRRRPIIM